MEYKIQFRQKDLRRALENAIQVTTKVPKDRPVLRHVKVSVPGVGDIDARFEATDSYVLFRQTVELSGTAGERSAEDWAFSLDHDTMKQIVGNIKSSKWDGDVFFRFFDNGLRYELGNQHWTQSDDWKWAATQWPNTQLIVDQFESGDAYKLNINSKVLTTIHKIRGNSHGPRTGERFMIYPAKDYLHKPFKVTLGLDVTLYVMPQRES